VHQAGQLPKRDSLAIKTNFEMENESDVHADRSVSTPASKALDRGKHRKTRGNNNPIDF
jgi:hypothetical protein